MLSSRGSLNIDAVFNECIGRSSSSRGAKVLPLTDAHAMWGTLGHFLRAQMLLGHPITIPKFCSFWCRQKTVAVQGNVRFLVRELCFGFTQSFVTTYNLDPMVPLEDPKLKFNKVPLDIIAAECGVPADVCGSILREVALFIGEGAFRGKSFNISFPSLVDVQLKKERAHVAPQESFVRELFGIDSRKWPADIREMAAANVLRPFLLVDGQHQHRPRSASSSSRPRTASSHGGGRPTTAGSSASAATAVPINRPMFVTALTQNKTFADIEKAPQREVRHRPRLPGAKGREVRSASGNRPSTGAGAGSASRHIDPLAPRPMSAGYFATTADQHEEESVYDVLSPSRQMAAAMNTRAPVHSQQHYDGYGGAYDDEADAMYLGEEGIDADNGEWEALNPSPHQIPQHMLLQSNNNTANTNGTDDGQGPLSATAPSSSFPLADRTRRADTHNNIFGNAPANAASPATPIGAPSCCKRIKAVFPWETALPLGSGGAEEHQQRLGGVRRHGFDDAENVDPSPSSAFGHRRRAPSAQHRAEQSNAKSLLYDNAYFKQ